MRIERRTRTASAALRRGVVLAGFACLLLAIPAASSARAEATSITVKVLNPGGSVRSTPAGIDCPDTCSAVLTGPVELTAAPADLWAFDHWEGDCATETGPTCKVASDASIAASASFRPASVLQLYVSGAGRVTSSPPGFDPETGKAATASCNALTRVVTRPAVPQPDTLCEVGYRAGQKVKLTAQGIAGLAQQAWSRYDCQVGKPCTVTMGEPGTTVDASFAGALLGVVVQGRGRVTSDRGGIDCGSACVAAVSTGTNVRLTASPGQDPFVEWGSNCSQTAVCDLTVDATKVIAAAFGAPLTLITPFLLSEHAYVSVHLGGLGTGSVKAAGPESGSATCEQSPCTKQFRVPELVALTATPGGGSSRFDRWLGGCPADEPNCEIDTRFITAVAACFAPLAPRDGLGVVRVVKTNGNRRLKIAIRSSSKATRLMFVLTRSGKSFALPTVRPSSLPMNVSVSLPKSLTQGTYSLRTRASDAIGCESILKARPVAVPRR